MQQTIKSFSLLLAGIAVISLIVGGIGIMNMMLVSISERKREIGIRKAIGAAFSDILTQFLTESIVICLVAGLCGVAFGYAISLVVVSFFEWELIVSSRSIILALTFALGTGMLFGIYPALKAARLPPMVALKDL